MSGYAYNYSGPSALASHLHSIGHVDWAMKPVATDPQSVVVTHTTAYIESITVLIGFPAIFVVLFVIGDAITMCCRVCRWCCCCRRKANMADDTYRCRLITGIVSAVAALLTVILAFTFSRGFEGDVVEVIHSIEDADAYRTGLVADLTAAASEVSLESSLLTVVLSNLTTAASNGANIPADVIGDLTNAAGQVSGAQSQLASQVVRFSTTFNLGNIINDIYQANDLQMNTSAFVFSLLLVTMSVLVLMSVLAESPNCCRHGLEVLALVSFFVSMSSACLHFGVSTAVADFCQTPDGFIHAVATQKFATDDLNVVTYYLYCNPYSSNPVNAEVEHAYTQLNTTTDPLLRLVSYLESNGTSVDTGLSRAVLSNTLYLQGNISATLELVNNTRSSLVCDRLHTDIVDSFERLCGSSLSAFYGVMWVQLISAIFLMLTRCCLPVRYTGLSKQTQMMYEEFAAPTDVIVTSADGTSPTSSRFARYAGINNHSVSTARPNDQYALAPTQDSPPTRLGNSWKTEPAVGAAAHGPSAAERAAALAAERAAAASAASNQPPLEPPLLQAIGSVEGQIDSPIGSTAQLPYGQPLLGANSGVSDD